jgi:antirestriction protein ArdC
MRRTKGTAATDAWDEKLARLKSTLDDQVIALTSSEGWLNWLKAAAVFHRYSANNVMLIMAQCPGATRVAGYRAWQKLDRQVRKGETALWIYAPRTVPDEEAAPGPDGKQPRKIIGVKPAKVFDISQTDGEPLAEQPRPELLTGQAPEGLWDAIAARITDHHRYTLTREPITSGANGYTDPKGSRVVVRDDVDDAQALKTLIHELAHIECRHVDDLAEYNRHRGRFEVEAESVAYIVAAALGLDTAAYSVNYVAHWASDTPEGVAETVQATATAVLAAAKRILDKVKPHTTGDAEEYPTPGVRPGGQAGPDPCPTRAPQERPREPARRARRDQVSRGRRHQLRLRPHTGHRTVRGRPVPLREVRPLLPLPVHVPVPPARIPAGGLLVRRRLDHTPRGPARRASRTGPRTTGTPHPRRHHDRIRVPPLDHPCRDPRQRRVHPARLGKRRLDRHRRHAQRQGRTPARHRRGTPRVGLHPPHGRHRRDRLSPHPRRRAQVPARTARAARRARARGLI